MTEPLLETKDLQVTFRSPGGVISLIREIDLTIRRGEIFALVGESGSGKTTLAYALTNLFLPFSGYTAKGKVMFEGNDLLSLQENALRTIRTRSIRYVFQEPAESMNPISRIKHQYRQVQHNVETTTHRRAMEQQMTDLAAVGIENPAEVLESYPHQLSGGTLQRILIALALSPAPSLIIADEPTSSVDAPLRYRLLDLLAAARDRNGSSVFLITHDLKIAQRYADSVAVLYGGRIIERAPCAEFFSSPLHPYSQMLLNTAGTEDIAFNDRMEHSFHPSAMPSGCAFHPVCPKVQESCRTADPMITMVDSERNVRCPYWK